MKITGKIIFEKTPGRKDPWVKKQVENDYFLAVQITDIDGKPINTTADTFQFMANQFPHIKLNHETINPIFENAILPPNAKNVSHITLGNFPDFRIDRNVANDIDQAKIAAALDLQDKVISFDIGSEDYEMVIATKDPQLEQEIKSNHRIEFENGNMNIVVAPTVGFNRDAILNLKPGFLGQQLLGEQAKAVFGQDFQIWNAQNKPIPFHITVAQSNQFIKKLEQAIQHQPAEEATPTLTARLG